jgi:hypothetical protein
LPAIDEITAEVGMVENVEEVEPELEAVSRPTMRSLTFV